MNFFPVALFATFALIVTTVAATDKSIGSVNVNSGSKAPGNGLEFTISIDGEVKLGGLLGLSLPISVGTATPTTCSDPATQSCFQYGDFANVTVTNPSAGNGNCARIQWTTTRARRLEDCFDISGIHMYGGAEVYYQHWPINEHKIEELPYTTTDVLWGPDFGGVMENYWLFSTGVAIHVDETTPLFLSWNTTRPNQLCFIATDSYPFENRQELKLEYDVCVGNDIKNVHLSTHRKFYKIPTGLPDETMLLKPLWSTWAQYGPDVNQSIVLDYANKVVSEGFLSSHIEIDDKWESCYGEFEFDPVKFPDPAGMVSQIKALGLRVTLWVHPFINFECPLFKTGVNQNYFVKDGKGRPTIAHWWAGKEGAGAIDISNEEAALWWTSRMEKLRTDYGIDSFKFDAGEVNWLPPLGKLEGEVGLTQNGYTTKYSEVVAVFGGLIETRVGHRAQEHPIFVRVSDRDSRWGHDVGLQSMIPTVLHFGILGYPFILPDMIGGFGEPAEPFPSKEMFIRWLQQNIFMPAMQFSTPPWDDHYDAEHVALCLELLALREKYNNEILAAADQAVLDGSPMNRPLWWVDPTDPETFTIDNQFMLGDTILVAPVVDQGAVTRDIYLPVGTWQSGVTNATHTGPTWLRNYPAPLPVLPFFIKM